MCDRQEHCLSGGKKVRTRSLGGDSYFLRDQLDFDFTVPCKGLYLTAEIAQSEEANGVDRGSGQTNMWGERKRITRLEG